MGPDLADANGGEKAGYAIVAAVVGIGFIVARWMKRGRRDDHDMTGNGVQMKKMRIGRV